MWCVEGVKWQYHLNSVGRTTRSFTNTSCNLLVSLLVSAWKMRLRVLLIASIHGRNVTLHRSLSEQDNEWLVEDHIWSPLRSIVEVNLCQHNGDKPVRVKSAIQKQDLKSIVFQHAWCMWGNSVQMLLMTSSGECMCALIDFMLDILCISIKDL